MGTIAKRGDKWRATVRRKGVTKTATFNSKSEGRDWISVTETAIVQRKVFANGFTFGECIAKYQKEVIEPKPYKTNKMYFHTRMLSIKFDKVEIRDMTAQWWCDAVASFKGVTPGTRQRYLTIMTSTLKHAAGLWKVTVDWDAYQQAKLTMKALRLIGTGRTRDRRLYDGEYERIVANIPIGRMPTKDAIDFALELGFRVSEITNLLWSDLDAKNKMLLVRMRKDPQNKMENDQNVPLLGKSLEILLRQPKHPLDQRIFPWEPDSFSNSFRNACKRAGIVGLTFHDLRHEAISRLFERGYGIPEVALVSGHKDWESLRKYTNLKPGDLHAGPISHQQRAQPVSRQRRAA